MAFHLKTYWEKHLVFWEIQENFEQAIFWKNIYWEWEKIANKNGTFKSRNTKKFHAKPFLKGCIYYYLIRTNSTSWPPTHEHILIHRGASTRGLHSSENCQWINHKTIKVYLTTKATTKDFVYQTCLISSRGFAWHSWR